MRCAIFTPNYPGLSGDGGIGTYTKSLIGGLKARGCPSVAISPGVGECVTIEGVDVFPTLNRHLPLLDRLLPGIGACWNVSRTMRKIVRNRSVDIVEFPNWEGLGSLFQLSSRVPTVVRLHTSSKETQLIDKLPSTRALVWDVRREWWQARQATALVTHTSAHRALMCEELGVAESRIEIIPHGVEVYPDYQRARVSINDSPVVVYLGRLENRKGTVDLLNAIPAVIEQFPKARFVLIGTDRPHCPGGRTHAEYLAQEFSPQVQKQVTLAGRLPQEQVDGWLKSADVFVAPSVYESFGLIFPEAMRWQTPVIGTSVGGIPEIISHGKTGWLIDPGSPVQITSAIVTLLTNEELRQRIALAGRKHVESEFALETMARRTIDFYQSVIDRRGRRHALSVS